MACFDELLQQRNLTAYRQEIYLPIMLEITDYSLT